MRSTFVALIFSLFVVQAQAQSFVVLQGQIKNSVGQSITLTYSNSWLDPVLAVKTSQFDDNGNFTLVVQFHEGMKPANLIYGTDTIEIILISGESLVLSADGNNFLKTIHFEGTGGPNANFCVKHAAARGLRMRHARAISFYYKKDFAAFKKLIDADYKKETDFIAKNTKGLTDMFLRYWKASCEYEKYYNILCYLTLHPNNDHATVQKVKASVPESFNDDLLLIPEYRQYVLAEAYLHDDARLYPEHREEQLKKFLYLTMPAQTGDYAAGSMVYALITTDAALAKAKFEEFKGHFPQSRYTPIIEIKLGAK